MSIESGVYILTTVRHKNLAAIRSEKAGSPLIAGIEEDSYNELVRSTSLNAQKPTHLQWRITKRLNGLYTISNFGNGFHATTPGRSKIGDAVEGRDQIQLWDIRETRVRGQYT